MTAGRVARSLAVAVYWTVTRLLLLVAFLFTSLFFVLNAGPFPAYLTRILQAALPGTIEVGTLQISPVPWDVDLLDIRVATPAGERVADVGMIRVKMDLDPLVAWLTGEAGDDLDLHFKSVQLSDFDVALPFEKGNHLRFLDAFVWPAKPKPADASPGGGGGTRVRLVFTRVVAERGACSLSFPDWDLRVEGLAFESLLRVGEDGRTLVRAPDLAFTGGVAHVLPGRDVAGVPGTVVLHEGRVTAFEYDFDRIGFERVAVRMDGLDLEATGGRLAFPRKEPLAYEGRAEIRLPAGSPLTTAATRGAVSGALALQVEGRGTDKDPSFTLAVRSPGLALLGRDLGETGLSVTGGRDARGAWAFSRILATAAPAGGTVAVHDATVWPYGRAPAARSAPEAEATLDLDGIDTARALTLFGLAAPGRPVPIPSGLGGTVRLGARLGDASDAGITLDVDAALSGALPAGTLAAGRTVSLKLDGSLATGTTAAGPAVHVRDLSLRAGRDALRARGRLDLGRRQVDATGSAELDLGPLLALAGLEGGGSVTLSSVRVDGDLAMPDVMARLRATGLAAGSWAVEELSGSLALHRGTVALTGIEAKAPWATVTAAEASVAVVDRAGRLDRAFPLRLREVSARGLDLARLPPLQSAGLRGKADVDVPSLALSVRDPPATLDGSLRVSIAKLQAAGKNLSKIAIEASATRGAVRLGRAVATLRGGGTIEATGTADLARREFELTARLGETPIPALAGTAPNGPLQGRVAVEATAAGRFSDPGLHARIEALDVAYGDVKAPRLSLAVDREPGGDLKLSADRFLPKLRLNPESGLTWQDGRFTGVVLMIDINRLTPQDLFPSIRPRDLTASLTGNLQLRMGLGAGAALEAALVSPPDGLSLKFFNREVALVNRGRLEAAIRRDGSVTLTGLSLDDGTRTLDACGVVMDPDGRARLLVRGAVGLYWLKALKDTFSGAEGYLRLAGDPAVPASAPPPGCGAGLGDGEPPMVLTGSLAQPAAAGTATFDGIAVTLRRFPDAIQVQPGARLVLRTTQAGRLAVEVPSDAWLRGSVGEGSFAVWGRAEFKGLAPAAGEIHLAGSGIRVVSPGQFHVVGDPDLKASFSGMAESEPKVAVTGQFVVREGSYYRNFDVVRKAFSGVTGARVAEREGPPLSAAFPWLAGTSLDIAVTGSHFGVRSRLPVGQTDLDLAFDLGVKGTVASPELWNRIEVLPGGKVVYEVVRREFEVVRGTLDFQGEPGHPLVDLTARTKVEYRGANTQSQSLMGTHGPDTSASAFDEDMVLVTLKVSGRYPTLDIELSSNTSDLDQTDLQYLLLTGLTRQGTQAGGGSSLNLGLLTDNVANVVTKLLLSPFVDAVRFGVSPTGAVNAEVMAHMGSRLKFETQVMQEQGGSRYSAGFQVRLTERLSLEGRVRATEGVLLSTQQTMKRVFESKLRYRIPLD